MPFNFGKFLGSLINNAAKPKPSSPPASAPSVSKQPPSKPLSAVKKPTTVSGASSASASKKSVLPQKTGQSVANHAPLTKIDPKKPNKGVASPEVYSLAKGNPLAQNVLKAFLHEGKPAYLSNHDYLKRFPHYRWNDDDTAGGEKILRDIEAARVQDEVDMRTEIVRDILSSSWMIAPSSTDWAYRYLHAEEIAQNPEDFQRLLEDAFGYTIEINTNYLSGDSDQLRQLQRLAESNLAIVEYFNKIGLPGSVIFQKYFAQNNGSDVIVQLGFDDVETPKGRIGPFQGLTPYADGDNTLSLGSQTSVATITHEFFHQLDRHFNPILSYEDPTLPPNEEMGLPNYLTQIAQNSLLPNDPTQHLPFQRFGIILGHASDDDEDNAEILADLGMTAVLAGLGYEAISPSGDKDTVGFDPRKQNAQDVECALRQYFVQIFSGKTSDFTFDLSLCS